VRVTVSHHTAKRGTAPRCITYLSPIDNATFSGVKHAAGFSSSRLRLPACGAFNSHRIPFIRTTHTITTRSPFSAHHRTRTFLSAWLRHLYVPSGLHNSNISAASLNTLYPLSCARCLPAVVACCWFCAARFAGCMPVTARLPSITCLLPRLSGTPAAPAFVTATAPSPTPFFPFSSPSATSRDVRSTAGFGSSFRLRHTCGPFSRYVLLTCDLHALNAPFATVRCCRAVARRRTFEQLSAAVLFILLWTLRLYSSDSE